MGFSRHRTLPRACSRCTVAHSSLIPCTGIASHRRSLVSADQSFRSSKSISGDNILIYVDEGDRAVVVSTELLNHPISIKLLNKLAQEYGYEQKGILRISCHVLVFERVMEAIHLGSRSCDLKDLLTAILSHTHLRSSLPLVR